jgi:serine/threonine-protein phosphatase 2B regulatory subunit
MLLCTVSQDEVTRLHKRFKKLDKEKAGTIPVQTLLEHPTIRQNPLAKRLIQVFDDDDSGSIDFLEFIRGISEAMGKRGTEDILKFAFKVYDLDRDGFIGTGELFLVLQMMVGNNLPPRQLQELVDKTIIEADTDEDGKISFAEFEKIIRGGSVNLDAVVGSLTQV